MGVVIGMDEAGYGPNLGPLVVTATVWEVPGDPNETSFWDEFSGIIDQVVPVKDSHIQIADSKAVHNSSAGVGPLEMGVFCALAVCDQLPISLCDLWSRIAHLPPSPSDDEPWFDDCDLPLPQVVALDRVRHWARQWLDRCAEHGIKLREIRSDVVLTRRFNQLTRAHDSKGIALSRISMQLLGQVWKANGKVPTTIIADKHGGRNRYDELLQEITGDRFIFRVEEGTQLSRYKVGQSEIRFETRAEAHFPVALASMVSKYLREVAMILFNNYWQRQLPDLRPTKGYPGDARRFKDEISTAQTRLKISDEVLWRER